jgi:hypothetical protein
MENKTAAERERSGDPTNDMKPETTALASRDAFAGSPAPMGSAFFACDSVTHEGETNTWFTPQDIIKTLGPFDLDPCTQSYRPFDTALRHICEDKGECGLSVKWQGRVWLNPPYGRTIARWLSKLADHGDGIALVFSRTETTWAQSLLSRADSVNFLKGRIAFLRANGKPVTNAGTGSMLLAFGAANVEAIKRIEGVIYTPNDKLTQDARP